LNELALFAGAGGGILGGHLLGWRTICAVERDAYAAQVLAQRQNDGILKPFPIWSDITTFDGTRWRGRVDVVSGGFPCQDISAAGKGKGIEGERSGLWAHMARIIGEVRPKYAFIENSPMLVSRGLDKVLCDIAKMGFNAEWGIIGADACGLDHHRARIWLVANSKEINGNSWDLLEKSGIKSQRKFRRFSSTKISTDWRESHNGPISVKIFRDPIDGLAPGVDELAALGNGQVPRVAAAAFTELSRRINK
jgi:DNA (cytosine-5)-methyltransferase 1